jgi:hypothetical protein
MLRTFLKNDKFAFKGDKSRGVRRTFWLIKVVHRTFWLIKVVHRTFWLIKVVRRTFWLIKVVHRTFWLIKVVRRTFWLIKVVRRTFWLIKVVHRTFWLIKVVPTWKKFEKRCHREQEVPQESNFPHFTESESSLPCSQNTITGPYHESYKLSSHTLTLFNIRCNTILSSMTGPSSRILLSGFSTTT